MLRNRDVAVLGVLMGLAGVCPVWAQNAALEAQNKLLAKRAAEADCYRKLAESVYGMKINAETYVRDFVTESDVIRSGVDAFIKGIRLGQPRYYDDGVCEIDGEVTVEKVVTTLKEVHTAHYKGNRVTTTDFEQMKQTIKSDVIKATGSGAPRPELPPDLPMGAEQMITPLPAGYAPTLSVPPIWKTVSPQGRLLAERAAQMDAARRLLEQIKGLRLTSDTLVRDFITESDEIRTKAEGIVVGATQVGKYLHTDDLIVEVTMEVPVEKLITTIKELHTQHYHGNKVTTTDIEHIKQSIQRDVIRATGSGVPRPDMIAQASSAGYQPPAWMAKSIDATGQGTDPAIDTAQGKLKAARVAYADAMRKLAEQIYGLQIQSGTTVKDFITQHDEIRTQVDAVLAGAVSGEASFTDGMASVTVSILAADVWSVVHEHMKIVQRRG